MKDTIISVMFNMPDIFSFTFNKKYPNTGYLGAGEVYRCPRTKQVDLALVASGGNIHKLLYLQCGILGD